MIWKFRIRTCSVSDGRVVNGKYEGMAPSLVQGTCNRTGCRHKTQFGSPSTSISLWINCSYWVPVLGPPPLATVKLYSHASFSCLPGHSRYVGPEFVGNIPIVRSGCSESFSSESESDKCSTSSTFASLIFIWPWGV